MKDANKKFEGFADTLIAQSLNEWAGSAKFVGAKLEQRLALPQDELDVKIKLALIVEKEKERERHL